MARDVRAIRQVAPVELDQMLAYRWPGNVRELENILERAIVKCQGSTITDVDLPVVSHQLGATSTYTASNDKALTLKQWLLKSEKEYLRGLLMKHEGHLRDRG